MRNKVLLVINNWNEGVQLSQKKFEKIFFCPTVKSPIQKKFISQCFESVKKSVSCAVLCSVNEALSQISKDDDVFVCIWPSVDEKLFLQNLQSKVYSVTLARQNRLLENFETKEEESFSSFRKKAEKLLPQKYINEHQYFDQGLQKRLNFYFGSGQFPSTYFLTRNQLYGKSYSSQLSPFLSLGVLNVRHLFNVIRNYESKYGSNKSTYWLIFELLWRDFFYHTGANSGSHIFLKQGLKSSSQNKSFFKYDQQLIEERCSTDLFMSCAYKELVQTGFLSNRVRQLFASVLINEWSLDWRLGAAFFEKYLIDYDVFSNYGNWQYIAGVGLDPKGGRHFDLQKQLSIYDPDNEYINYWKRR